MLGYSPNSHATSPGELIHADFGTFPLAIVVLEDYRYIEIATCLEAKKNRKYSLKQGLWSKGFFSATE
jgi:hypothetical protein